MHHRGTEDTERITADFTDDADKTKWASTD